MSTNYSLYTEAKYGDEWYCLNHRMPRICNDSTSIASTYWSGSRSYFGCAAEKLESLGCRLDANDAKDLSELLRESFQDLLDDKCVAKYVIDYEDIKKVIPENMEHEFHGYASKDSIFAYESGDNDDIYDYLSAQEYSELDSEAKKAYCYYEWDDPAGWFRHFKDIIEHVQWQLYEWNDVNYMIGPEKVRIIMFVC